MPPGGWDLRVRLCVPQVHPGSVRTSFEKAQPSVPRAQKIMKFKIIFKHFFFHIVKIEHICELLQKTACPYLLLILFYRPSNMGTDAQSIVSLPKIACVPIISLSKTMGVSCLNEKNKNMVINLVKGKGWKIQKSIFLFQKSKQQSPKGPLCLNNRKNCIIYWKQ